MAPINHLMTSIVVGLQCLVSSETFICGNEDTDLPTSHTSVNHYLFLFKPILESSPVTLRGH